MTIADVPLAADVLGVVETDDGRVIGLADGPTIANNDLLADIPDDAATAAAFGPEQINRDAKPGEPIYSRRDAEGTTLEVTNRNRTKVTKGGAPIEPVVALWRIDNEKWVRVPVNQVVAQLNKRDDRGRRVFSQRATNVTPRALSCPYAEDTGCLGTFKSRSDMLLHAQKRHPALFAAQALDNEQLQVEAMRTLIAQSQAQQDQLASMMAQQTAALVAAMDKLAAAGMPLTPDEVAKVQQESAPSEDEDRAKTKRTPRTNLDALPRVERVV